MRRISNAMIVKFVVDSVENRCMMRHFFRSEFSISIFAKIDVPVGVAPSRRCSRPRALTPPPRPMLKAVVVVEDKEATLPNSIEENAGDVKLQSPVNC